jgi:hypothetical protein
VARVVDHPLPDHANTVLQGTARMAHHKVRSTRLKQLFASEGITSTFGSSRFSGKTKRRQEAVVQPSLLARGNCIRCAAKRTAGTDVFDARRRGIYRVRRRGDYE